MNSFSKTDDPKRKTNFKFKVNIIESERGWGSKIDEVKSFDTYEDAERFIEEHNKQNNLDEVPDLYWRAERANYQKVRK